MAEQTIVGVDFSGAKADNATWVTMAVLRGNSLIIESCFPLPREELTRRLVDLSGNTDAFVGMDFPFGLPCDFIREKLSMSATKMPEIWKYADGLDLPNHIPDLRQRLRHGDLKKYNKLMRKGDSKHFKESYSPLNPASPEMFPMTFYGMKMLHTLWSNTDCKVPPLSENGRTGPLLLETMPGAVINAFGLPHKGFKNGKRRLQLRAQVLDGLQDRSGVPIANLAEFRPQCLESHDCLDSLVAAVAAFLWVRDQEQFRRPGDTPLGPPAEGRRRASSGAMAMSELDAARLEGWIYAPYPISKSVRA